MSAQNTESRFECVGGYDGYFRRSAAAAAAAAASSGALFSLHFAFRMHNRLRLTAAAASGKALY